MHYSISLWESINKQKYLKKEELRKFFLQKTAGTLQSFFKTKNVKRVYIVGSLLNEGQFTEYSDIDIAVEGLQEDYFAVMTRLEDLLDREVDIIELEHCRFADAIKKKGLLVYEK